MGLGSFSSWSKPKKWFDNAKDVVEDVAKVAVAPIVLPTKFGVEAVKTTAEAIGGLLQKPSYGDDGGVDDVTSEPIKQLETEREDNKKKRRQLYATQGGALGEEVSGVGNTFGAGRGSLFGN